MTMVPEMFLSSCKRLKLVLSDCSAERRSESVEPAIAVGAVGSWLSLLSWF